MEQLSDTITHPPLHLLADTEEDSFQELERLLLAEDKQVTTGIVVEKYKPKGRKATSSKYIDANKSRSVTFSKRKDGIMKKVYQAVCMTNCNAFVAIQQIPAINSVNGVHQDSSLSGNGSASEDTFEGSPPPPPPLNEGEEPTTAIPKKKKFPPKDTTTKKTPIEAANHKIRNTYVYACKTWRTLFADEAIEELFGKPFTEEEIGNTNVQYQQQGISDNSYRIVREDVHKDERSDHTDRSCVIAFGNKRKTAFDDFIILDAEDEFPIKNPEDENFLEEIAEEGTKEKKKSVRTSVENKFIADKKRRGTCFCKRKNGILTKVFELVGRTRYRCLVVLSYPEQEGGSDLYHVYCSPDWREFLIKGKLLNLLYETQQQASRPYPPLIPFSLQQQKVPDQDLVCSSASKGVYKYGFTLPARAAEFKIVATNIEEASDGEVYVCFSWKNTQRPATTTRKKIKKGDSDGGFVAIDPKRRRLENHVASEQQQQQHLSVEPIKEQQILDQDFFEALFSLEKDLATHTQEDSLDRVGDSDSKDDDDKEEDTLDTDTYNSGDQRLQQALNVLLGEFTPSPVVMTAPIIIPHPPQQQRHQPAPPKKIISIAWEAPVVVRPRPIITPTAPRSHTIIQMKKEVILANRKQLLSALSL